MSRVDGEEGPRFGPLRPGRPVVVRANRSAVAGRRPRRTAGARSSSEFNPGAVVGWLGAGVASIVAAAVLLEIWAGPSDAGAQGQGSLVVAASWGFVLLFLIARDRSRALRMFNVVALLCALLFVAIIVLAIVQFVRLAGES